MADDTKLVLGTSGIRVYLPLRPERKYLDVASASVGVF